MKSIFTLLIFAISILNIQSQTKTTWTEIERQVKDSNSEFYYPDLIERYNKLDSTLTTDDYAHIYLGFVFQDDYIKSRPDESKMQELKKVEKQLKMIKLFLSNSDNITISIEDEIR